METVERERDTHTQRDGDTKRRREERKTQRDGRRDRHKEMKIETHKKMERRHKEMERRDTHTHTHMERGERHTKRWRNGRGELLVRERIGRNETREGETRKVTYISNIA